MTDVLLKCEGVGKKFTRKLRQSMVYGLQDMARCLVGKPVATHDLRSGEFWSLDNVSFELRRGECLGVIGPNGAGKSTLLKILTGIFLPDRGRVEVRGRVGALIELGAGFHPALTGRENIYVNGAILGFSKKEIDRKLDEIIDFSEIEEFIDAPVRTYSSGMSVKLGFAIAAQMEPDILIIDEVLAVGDVGFRAKCYNYVANVNQEAAVLFVSHNMNSVGRICSRGLVLQQGVVVHQGEVHRCIEAYHDLFSLETACVAGSGRAKIKDLKFLNEKGHSYSVLPYSRPFSIAIEVNFIDGVKNPVFFIGFHDKELRCVAEINSRNNNVIIDTSGGTVLIKIFLDKMILNPGDYKVSCCVYCENMREHLTWHFAAWDLKVLGNFCGMNPVQFFGDWQIMAPFQDRSND